MNLLTIFVFVLIIVLVYVVYKLMTKSTASVSGFSDASKSLKVPSSNSGSATTNNFGYSAWLYIDTWVNSGKNTINKNVITRCNSANIPLFKLYLDDDQNNLNLIMKGNESSPCTIRNVQLQKWINITMSVYGNTVDLYLDGKLVRTCIMPVIPPTLTPSTDNLYIGGGYNISSQTQIMTPSDGDLQGYLSNVIYKATYFTPEEAWSIYSDGYSGAGMFNFLNSYKLNFSVTKNNQTVGEVSI